MMYVLDQILWHSQTQAPAMQVGCSFVAFDPKHTGSIHLYSKVHKGF
jgi:hypothetical protein